MRIAILGPGAIGSTFAFQLSRARHDVTVIARGSRLEQLTKDQAIVRADGERAAVTVAASLDTSVPFDLLLVTVLAPQVGAVLPALSASAATKVMFMFNTFESIVPLRDAVGATRFTFGFPGGVFTLLKAGRIAPQIRAGTTVSDAELSKHFSDAGIPTVVDDDMQSWLRTHAAMVFPMMATGVRSFTRGHGLSFGESLEHADAFRAGFQIVRAMGNSIRPKALGSLASFPRWVTAALLWALSRTKLLRELGELGTAEPRMLADMMAKAQPALAEPIVRVRP